MKIERFHCDLYGTLIRIVLSNILLCNAKQKLYESEKIIISEYKAFKIIKKALPLIRIAIFKSLTATKTEVQSDVIREFIVDRLIPYNRMNLSKYLKYYDMEFWEEWDLFLKAKGMCFLDTFWIRRNSKETYKECHIKFTNSVKNDLLTEEYFFNEVMENKKN